MTDADNRSTTPKKKKAAPKARTAKEGNVFLKDAARTMHLVVEFHCGEKKTIPIDVDDFEALCKALGHPEAEKTLSYNRKKWLQAQQNNTLQFGVRQP